jgi:solute:Na+ symporter, SSS family
MHSAPVVLLFAFVQLTHLSPLDVLILVLFVVIFTGFHEEDSLYTSEGFSLANCKISTWIARLSFVSTNLSLLDLIGWAEPAYHGILAMRRYGNGRIPSVRPLNEVERPASWTSSTTIGANLC